MGFIKKDNFLNHDLVKQAVKHTAFVLQMDEKIVGEIIKDLFDQLEEHISNREEAIISVFRFGRFIRKDKKTDWTNEPE